MTYGKISYYYIYLKMCKYAIVIIPSHKSSNNWPENTQNQYTGDTNEKAKDNVF